MRCHKCGSKNHLSDQCDKEGNGEYFAFGGYFCTPIARSSNHFVPADSSADESDPNSAGPPALVASSTSEDERPLVSSSPSSGDESWSPPASSIPQASVLTYEESYAARADAIMAWLEGRVADLPDPNAPLAVEDIMEAYIQPEPEGERFDADCCRCKRPIYDGTEGWGEDCVMDCNHCEQPMHIYPCLRDNLPCTKPAPELTCQPVEQEPIGNPRSTGSAVSNGDPVACIRCNKFLCTCIKRKVCSESCCQTYPASGVWSKGLFSRSVYPSTFETTNTSLETSFYTASSTTTGGWPLIRLGHYARRRERRNNFIFADPPTQLQGAHGILIDTGAVQNLHSDYWRRRFQKALDEHGLIPRMRRSVATFTGIGGKPDVSTREMRFPICVDGQCGTFTSQEMEESRVPAILGLTGLEANKAMIIPHDERIIIPNGGKVRITVSKEVQIVKCIRTPSGHLLLPCDQWDREDEFKQDKTITLFEGETTPASSSDEPTQ